ncbi:MAG: hypothetical protein DMG65_22140 [Candidatus Angelobacter sp. Gp1-AA117]|nr:MAG: hypothetical protein DMG65_22140 [Candidatus Angelobacter sp. Gp1-AA117]
MILDHFATRKERFRPTDIVQYTVFQIARQFNDTESLRDYLRSAERYSSAKLIHAYQAASLRDDKHSAFFQSLIR